MSQQSTTHDAACLHFGSSHFGSSFPCSCGRVSVLFACCLSGRRHMVRNRKWVLQDNLQEAVWRTIMRGPRPPSVPWEKRNPSAASRDSNTTEKPLKKPDVKATNWKATKPQGQGSVPLRVPLHPDEAMAAARSRVAKLQTVLPRWERTTTHLRRSKPLSGRHRSKRRNVRADQEHSIVCCSEPEASRGGSPGHHSGQGGIGESSHSTGGAGSTLGRREEVGSTSGERESNAIPVHCSRTHGWHHTCRPSSAGCKR